MSESIDPVVPPPGLSARQKWIVASPLLLGLALTVAIVCCMPRSGASSATASNASYTPSIYEPSASYPPSSAYPLHAHDEQYGDKTVVVCDATDAFASLDGRNGVAVQVHVEGPGVVSIDVIAGMGHDYHLQQQVTRRGGGAEFDFGATGPVYSVSVSASNSHADGLPCDVPVPR